MAYLICYHRKALKGNILTPLIIMNTSWTIYVIMEFAETDKLATNTYWMIGKCITWDVIKLILIRVLFRVKASTIYVLREYTTEDEIRKQLKKAQILEFLNYFVQTICCITCNLNDQQVIFTRAGASILVFLQVACSILRYYFLCYFMQMGKENAKIFKTSMNINLFRWNIIYSLLGLVVFIDVTYNSFIPGT